MNGIPDPGRASKAVEMIVSGAAPFDAGRTSFPQGGEEWVRRAVRSSLRPSGTTQGGAR